MGVPGGLDLPTRSGSEAAAWRGAGGGRGGGGGRRLVRRRSEWGREMGIAVAGRADRGEIEGRREGKLECAMGRLNGSSVAPTRQRRMQQGPGLQEA
ncbi:hypothetical protein E2562_030514 [Oryza meyeriana var. granulata]|uniref:DUF834 domain-containing protein n=1 Tax=Oryza meyeriana var. granulata TaxID=110450 RepID=A0A6G1BPG2_9ORYZ|nr:hypothetical protein E2562_030514 [Oryza meyeriana var. granulata]